MFRVGISTRERIQERGKGEKGFKSEMRKDEKEERKDTREGKKENGFKSEMRKDEKENKR